MKQLTFLLMLASSVAFAQKPIKPNLNKLLNLWKEGKLEEAKAMADAATTYDKTMNDGKTWYYRGLVYATLDTIKDEKYKSLAPDAFTTAVESFKKADQMASPKSEYFITGDNLVPQPKANQMAVWANYYLNEGAALYQDEDYPAAVEKFERVQKILPDDTTAYFYAGFAANQNEEYEKALQNFKSYVDKGGTSSDAYALMININSGPKENKERALELVREARTKFPNNADFPKVEIGLLIDLKRIEEAKKGLEAAIAKEPQNKTLHFYLGYANASLGNLEAAKKNYEDALKIDPKYFEAQLYLAKLMYTDAADIKKQMSNLGITAADKKKRFDLDKVLVEKLKVALPYWEQAERINPSDQEVLDVLYSIYTDLDMQNGIARVNQRYKELGMDN